MNLIVTIVSTNYIKNFQNFLVGNGFSRIAYPKTHKVTKNDIKSAFQRKLRQTAKITIV
jgi:hypothetical protein